MKIDELEHIPLWMKNEYEDMLLELDAITYYVHRQVSCSMSLLCFIFVNACTCIGREKPSALHTKISCGT